MARRTSHRRKHHSRRRSSKGNCGPGYRRNPSTGRCIYMTGNKGRKAFNITYKRSHKREHRPSPEISALSVPVGTVRTGHDGALWKVKRTSKSQRWVKA